MIKCDLCGGRFETKEEYGEHDKKCFGFYSFNSTNPDVYHYNTTDIQPLDVIADWTVIWRDDTWFCGNIIKYIRRYRQKNGIDDLKKARDYLDLLIKKYETK